MKGSIKPALTGTGVVLGLQLILSIVVKIYVGSISQAPGSPMVAGQQFSLIFIGVSLGTFMIGGLILGFMQERVNLGIPIAVAVVAMLLAAFVSAVFALPDNIFLLSYIKSEDWLSLVITVAGGIVITVVGGLIGERFRTPAVDDPLSRGVVIVALAFILIGPFFFLAEYGFPWYVVIIAVLTMLVLVGVGYYRFHEGTTIDKSMEEISISPDRQ